MRKHRPPGENREGTFGKCPYNKNGKEKGESDSVVCKYTYDGKTVQQISCGKVGVRHRKKIFRIENCTANILWESWCAASGKKFRIERKERPFSSFSGEGLNRMAKDECYTWQCSVYTIGCVINTFKTGPEDVCGGT